VDIKNAHYFIEFANYSNETIEKMYDKFPTGIVDESENWPVLETPIEANLHSLFKSCRGNNLCLIPERMTIFAKSFQQLLRNILYKIIENQGVLSESDELNFIITLQERTITKYEVENGRLTEQSVLNPDDESVAMMTPGWLKYSCQSLIDFLCNENLKRLKNCPYCKEFYASKKLNPNQRYCSSCSKKDTRTKEEKASYQRAYRKVQKKRREREKKRKLEKEALNLIAQGIRPKEARELAELKMKDK